MLTGSRFQGISQASGGNFQDSSTNYPVVQLRDIDNSQVAFLPVDPIAGWSDTTFTSTPVNNFPPGPALVTVFTNGIPSDSKYVLVTSPVPSPTPTRRLQPPLPRRPQRPQHLHLRPSQHRLQRPQQRRQRLLLLPPQRLHLQQQLQRPQQLLQRQRQHLHRPQPRHQLMLRRFSNRSIPMGRACSTFDAGLFR